MNAFIIHRSARALARSYSSASKSITGVNQILSSKEKREADRRASDSAVKASEYQSDKGNNRKSRAGLDEYKELGEATASGIIAERRILEALKRGDLANNKYAGKPLPQKEHDVTHFGHTDDYEIFKVLANSGMKPEFIERNNELREVLPKIRAQFKSAVERRQQAGGSITVADMERETGEGKRPFSEIFAEANELIKQYNTAWLKDSENLRGGFHMPLGQRPLMSIEREIRRVLEGK